jgi:hypothetical protein
MGNAYGVRFRLCNTFNRFFFFKSKIVSASAETEITQILRDEKLMLVYSKQNCIAVCYSHRNFSANVKQTAVRTCVRTSYCRRMSGARDPGVGGCSETPTQLSCLQSYSWCLDGHSPWQCHLPQVSPVELCAKSWLWESNFKWILYFDKTLLYYFPQKDGVKTVEDNGGLQFSNFLFRLIWAKMFRFLFF